MSGPRALPRPERVRTVERPFAWLPCRMLTNGTIASMSPDERQLYLLLALAADRHGVSFYSDKRIGRILGCTQQQLHMARHALIARELVAYDGATYQLLPLPENANPTPSASQDRSAASAATNKPTICVPRTTEAARRTTSSIDASREHSMPESLQHILRGCFDPQG